MANKIIYKSSSEDEKKPTKKDVSTFRLLYLLFVLLAFVMSLSLILEFFDDKFACSDYLYSNFTEHQIDSKTYIVNETIFFIDGAGLKSNLCCGYFRLYDNDSKEINTREVCYKFENGNVRK